MNGYWISIRNSALPQICKRWICKSLNCKSIIRKYSSASFFHPQVHNLQVFLSASFSSARISSASSWSASLFHLQVQNLQVFSSATLQISKPCDKALGAAQSSQGQTRPGQGSIGSSPRCGLSTPYRLTIRNSARLFHYVLSNMGDLYLVLPALNLSNLNAGILIR